MTKRVFSAICVFLCTAMCTLFCGCTSYDESFVIDGTYCGAYSRFKRNAYIGSIEWNGDLSNTVFTVPDDYNGYKITQLGGYFGVGVPDPFGININGLSDCFLTEAAGSEDCGILEFKINLGKNIFEIANCFGKAYLETADGFGSGIHVYKIVYFFSVDSANPVLYSSDGRLYYKSDNKPAEEFFYG